MCGRRHAPKIRKISAAHDMAARAEAIVEHLARGDLRGIGGPRRRHRQRRLGTRAGSGGGGPPIFSAMMRPSLP